jgi:hypothetical protein
MAWREVYDRQSGRLIGVAFDDCSHTQQAVPLCHFKSGAQFQAHLKVIEHPEGRFRRPDGTRVDVMVLDLLQDYEIAPPAITPRDVHACQRECLEDVARARFVGEGRDQLNGGSCVRISSTQAA